MQPNAHAAGTGWVSMQCQACGAALTIGASERATKCPYCAAPAVVERPHDASQPDPAFVIGFVVTADAAKTHLRKWLRTRWFAPSALKRADIAEARGVYVPVYIYTAAAEVRYSAKIGENYTVTETYTTTDAKGNAVTRTRTRVETEWRSLEGPWFSYLDDIVVTASTGLPNAELEAIEPYDLRSLRRFAPQVLAGWIAEDPSMQSAACLDAARSEAQSQIARRLAAHMPGDSHRSLEYTSQFVHEHIELALVPVWILAVRHDPSAPVLRVVLNGQTGELAGRAPTSWVKIVAAVLAVLAVVAIVALVLSLR